MLEFLRGSGHRPSGNLLVYTYANDSSLFSGKSGFILCNIYVSLALSEPNRFPVVVFPPILLNSEKEIATLLEIHSHYDVIRLEDFRILPKENPKLHVRRRLRDVNKIVETYVSLCRKYWKKINLKKIRPLRSFLNDSYFMYDIPESIEEATCLDQLEIYLKVYQTEAQTVEPYFLKLLRVMNDKYPNYDVANLARTLGIYSKELERNSIYDISNPDEVSICVSSDILKASKGWAHSLKTKKSLTPKNFKLATLYLQKFRAIHKEEYEKAAKIQSYILNVESEQNSP